MCVAIFLAHDAQLILLKEERIKINPPHLPSMLTLALSTTLLCNTFHKLEEDCFVP